MRVNPLMIAVVVLGVLGGAVWYTRENPPTPDDDKVALIESKEEDVRRVVVRKQNGEMIEVVRGEDDKWKFGGDIDAPADDSAIGFMITNLASLDADRVVEEQVADWTPFGLAGDGSLSVEVDFKEGEPRKVVFGKDTPTGAGVFARLEGDPRLFTAYSYAKSSFDKTVFDWRDKKLLRVDQDKTSRVALTVGSRSFEFGRSGDGAWQILKPRPVRADNFAVGDLTRSLLGLEMTKVLEESDDGARKYPFSRPYATAEIVDDTGSRSLTIAKTSEETYVAKSSDLPGVYEISTSSAEGLDKDLVDLRNKKLFDFGFSELSKVVVRDGERRAELRKQDDKWLLASDGDREVDAEKARALIDALRNLSASAFPSDAASEQSRYGLDAPVVEAEVLKAEEGAKPERVVLTEPAKDRVYAARAGEPSTYQVERAPAEAIREALDAMLAPAEPAAEEASE